MWFFIILTPYQASRFFLRVCVWWFGWSWSQRRLRLNYMFFTHSHFLCITPCFKEPSNCIVHVIFPLLHSHVLPYCIWVTSEDIISFKHSCKLNQLLLKFTELGIFIRITLPDLYRGWKLLCTKITPAGINKVNYCLDLYLLLLVRIYYKISIYWYSNL